MPHLPAAIQLLAKDRPHAGIPDDVRPPVFDQPAPEFTVPAGPRPQIHAGRLTGGLRIEPPDWEAEARERAEREREAEQARLAELLRQHSAQVQSELEPAVEAEQPPPRRRRGLRK